MERFSKRVNALSSDPPPLSLPQEPINTPSQLFLSSDEFNEGMTHIANIPRQSKHIKSKQMQMGPLKMGNFSKRVNPSSNSNCSDPELRKVIGISLKVLYPSDPPPDQTNDRTNGSSQVAPVSIKGSGRAASKKQPPATKGKSRKSYSKQQKILSNSTTSDNQDSAALSLDCPAKRTRRNTQYGDAQALNYDNLMAFAPSEHVPEMNGNFMNPPMQPNDPYDYTIQTRSMANAVSFQQQQTQFFAPHPVLPQQHQGQWNPTGGYDSRGNSGIAEHASQTGSTIGSVCTSRSREWSQLTEGSVTRRKHGRMPYPKNRKRTTEEQRNDPLWREKNEKATESVRKWRNKRKLEDEAKDMFLMDAMILLGAVEARKLLPSNPTEAQLRTFNKFYDDAFRGDSRS